MTFLRKGTKLVGEGREGSCENFTVFVIQMTGSLRDKILWKDFHNLVADIVRTGAGRTHPVGRDEKDFQRRSSESYTLEKCDCIVGWVLEDMGLRNIVPEVSQ